MGSRPAVLLIDDGELDDIAALLLELGPRVVRRLPEDLIPGQGVLDGSLRLIVATGRRAIALRELPGPPTDPAPTRVAVVSGSSRMLRGALQRVGFHYLVHRPVHPDALRLLFARLLYEGPEKRRAERVAVGAPISFRAGLRRRSGTLVELSATGCRLAAAVAPPAQGAHITVFFQTPKEGAPSRSEGVCCASCSPTARPRSRFPLVPRPTRHEPALSAWWRFTVRDPQPGREARQGSPRAGEISVAIAGACIASV